MKRTLISAVLAGLFIDATFIAASQASRMTQGAQWLAVLLLGSAGLIAVCSAVGYGFGAGWQAGSAAVFGRRLARSQQPVEAAPVEQDRPVGYTPASQFDEYWVETRRAAREAESGDYRAYTAVHAAPKPQLPPTLTMSVIDLGTFDLSECRVSEYGGTR